ncbi:hypothetical protein BN903_299 [Halorubrum sp. AJ67]|nr:hypothetical protein BN903_299 [Halorubrum sp. AJ67]
MFSSAHSVASPYGTTHKKPRGTAAGRPSSPGTAKSNDDAVACAVEPAARVQSCGNG